LKFIKISTNNDIYHRKNNKKAGGNIHVQNSVFRDGLS